MNLPLTMTLDEFAAKAGEWRRQTLGENNAELVTLRFAEEACELVQAREMPFEVFLAIALSVWDKPAGNWAQEVGGVMMCLGTMSDLYSYSLARMAIEELQRAHEASGVIREKDARKPQTWSDMEKSKHGDNVRSLLSDKIQIERKNIIEKVCGLLTENARARKNDSFNDGYEEGLNDLLREYFKQEATFFPARYEVKSL